MPRSHYTLTTRTESASGISEGGKTGLQAITTSFWFFVSIFFAPILSNIPSWATGSVLVIVGSMMMQNVVKINWDYLGDALPAFIVVACIPFTCQSISPARIYNLHMTDQNFPLAHR